MDAKGTCPECGFSLGKTIYRHLLNVHSWSKDRVEELKTEKRNLRALSFKGSDELLRCECGLLFQSARGLAIHQKQKHHGDSHSSRTSIVCPLCEAGIKDYVAFVQHVSHQHSDSPEDYVMETKTFSNIKDFEEWKHDLEEKAGARFFVSHSAKRPSGVVTYMKCSRSTSRLSYNKAATKKAVHHCTAHIQVKETGATVSARFCKTHFGHDIETAQLSGDKESTEYVECAPSNVDVMKYACNELETYMAGLKSNILSLSEVPSDEATQDVLSLVAEVKDLYYRTGTLMEKHNVQRQESVPPRSLGNDGV